MHISTLGRTPRRLQRLLTPSRSVIPHRGGVSHADPSSPLVPINDIFLLQSMRPPVLHQIKCEHMRSKIFMRLVTGGTFTHVPPSRYAPPGLPWNVKNIRLKLLSELN